MKCFFLLFPLLLSGCAYTYEAGDGSRGIVGLVHLKIPAPASPELTGADWIRIRNVGIALNTTPFGNSLEVGYSDNTFAIIRNNSCVRIDQSFSNAPTTKGGRDAFIPAQ